MHIQIVSSFVDFVVNSLLQFHLQGRFPMPMSREYVEEGNSFLSRTAFVSCLCAMSQPTSLICAGLCLRHSIWLIVLKEFIEEND